MAISSEEVIHLPWDESLTLAGVTYVQNTLSRILGVGPWPSASGLRGLVASLASDLALRRWLDGEQVPYTLIGDEPFTRPARPRLVLGGRRLILQTTLVSSRRAIRRLRGDPHHALEASAAILPSTLDAAGLSEGDLLAFALSLALETRTLTELEKAMTSGHPAHLLALPPDPSWIRPLRTTDLGVVTVSSPSGCWDIILQGVLSTHVPWSTRASLDPSTRFQSPPLHSLIALHTFQRPPGPLLACSESHPAPWRLQPGEWWNLWLYGIETLLLGWSTVREFRAASSRHTPARTASDLSRPPRGSLQIAGSDLMPLSSLLEHLRQT